ncbi:Uncharacterized conserved protein, DUF302 family [Litoreibacter ascidiaceicola]|uniref:Uncharacterized conserved protein, DUF302 family n=1 Tax=Litoreibacter ascidiaceicola TaxID=1486859 RepID=A0A1M4V9Z5_9RHOB|nr:DUF302 domain-containing protein [Litoreibacter ascidiaceicola]SHE65710.1 Uncharacterized conserved protein, DUF302 family [Litoreibacter ascidiaceicola]
MRAILSVALSLWAGFAAADVTARPGWVVMETSKPYDQLVQDVVEAVKANKMGVVTQAGPTGAAKARGITIPGNRVIGVFNNAFAVRILALSTSAMIEAPVRLYVTETHSGATLSYKTPSLVFAPYMEESDPDLGVAASELDVIFKTIADAAAG